MSFLKIFYVLVVLCGFASATAQTAERISEGVRSSLVSFGALGGWRDWPGYAAGDGSNPFLLPRVEISCADTLLFPTHPQQETKIYHIYQIAQYDQAKLNGDDPACLMSARYANGKGVKACLRADYAHYVVLSDLYRDRCGGLYRGFWELAFLNRDESMGTLFSLGRVLFQKENSSVLDMYVASTYPVPRKEFLFLSPLLPGDREKIESLKGAALKDTHTLDQQGLLYLVR